VQIAAIPLGKEERGMKTDNYDRMIAVPFQSESKISADKPGLSKVVIDRADNKREIRGTNFRD